MKNNLNKKKIIKNIASLNETLYSRYKIEVPEGPLFYPCCGDDIFEPLKLFIDTVSEYHFVDINGYFRFIPELECSSSNKIKTPWNLNERQIFPSNIVKERLMVGREKRTLEDESFEEIQRLTYGFNLYRRKRKTTTLKEEWLYSPNEDRKIKIYRHTQDGLTKFMELDEIAVFFLRGDSLGEGGSGQEWFQPGLFDLILEKLLDGGYIVTDGSGLGYETQDFVKWRGLWKREGEIWDSESNKPKDFIYKDRKFVCIGECGERYGTVFLWRVDKI